MIKATFYNLPAQKKGRLFEAAHREFSKYDFHEASINRIIKDAEISRGSFYTYFDDKYDLVKALLEDYLRMIEHRIIGTLESSRGDLFVMFITIFDTTVAYEEIRQNMATFESLFKTLQISDSDSKGGKIIDEQRHIKQQQEMLRRVNRNIFIANTDEDLIALMDLLFFISRKAMINALSPTADIKAVRAKLCRQLEFLQNGAIKPEHRKPRQRIEQ